MWQCEGSTGESHVPWSLDGAWLGLSMQMRRRKAAVGSNVGAEAGRDR